LFDRTKTVDYPALTVVGISLFTVLLRFAKMRVSHLILFSGMFVMGILHQRYFVFTATVGMLIVGKEIGEVYKYLSKRLPSLTFNKIQPFATSFLVLFVLLFIGKISFAVAQNVDRLSSDHAVKSAEGAIRFIEQNKIPGRMFNTDLIGGYAIWRLYPWKQVFMDTRSLNIAYVVEYRNVVSANPAKVKVKPMWERILKMYDVNFVVTNSLHHDGSLLPLSGALLENERWALVYTDGTFMVFVRNSPENQSLIEKFPLKKEHGYWSIVAIASAAALHNADNPFLFTTIGECFMKLENHEEAEKAFNHALKIDPNNKPARRALVKLSNNRKNAQDKNGNILYSRVVSAD
jgi:hypothetical protein